MDFDSIRIGRIIFNNCMYIVILKFKTGFRICLTFFHSTPSSVKNHWKWRVLFFNAKPIRKIDPNNFSMIGNSTWIIFRLKKRKKSFFNDSQTFEKTKFPVKQYFPSIYSQSTSNNSSIETHFYSRKSYIS